MMTLVNWLDLLEQRHPQVIDLGLERCGIVYKRMGSPKPAKKVFTVAGTNGKGSTVAYLAAISGALGQRHGTYTSPHIFRFNERVCILGEPVSEDGLTQAFEQVEKARGDVSLTYFEFTTLAAFLILHQAELDCAILEVGLGGRLDTVNLVDTDCAVITPIGLDHQDFLGTDLESIATEKAGIIRPGAPVVCTQRTPPDAISQTARNQQAGIFRRGHDFDLIGDPESNGKYLQFSMADQSMLVSQPFLSGIHQLDNLAAALAAAQLMNPGMYSRVEDISWALAQCKLPGRLQIVNHAPKIILDVGHNELAANAIAAYLQETEKLKVICVLAMLADKPVEATVRALNDDCNRWICADSPGYRGQTAAVLAARVNSARPSAEVIAAGSVDQAMQDAVRSAKEGQTILVFGSFTTVSEAAAWVQNSMQREQQLTARIS